MFVKGYMSSPVITIQTDTPLPDAVKILRDHKIRRLPVLNPHGDLAGIISERDLRHASPSPATALNIWEINYLLAKLQVEELMAKEVITLKPDSSVADAAKLMLDKKIGGIPIVDGEGGMVGLITESDIFKAFINRHYS